MLRSLLIVLVCVALAGCSSHAPPKLSVGDLTVTDASADAVVISFTLAAENPGVKPLVLGEIEYTVAVDGREVFRGKREAQAVLYQYASTKILVPAPARIPEAQRADAQVAVTGRLAYVPPTPWTKLMGEISLGRDSVSFSGSGRLPLK